MAKVTSFATTFGYHLNFGKGRAFEFFNTIFVFMLTMADILWVFTCGRNVQGSPGNRYHPAYVFLNPLGIIPVMPGAE